VEEAAKLHTFRLDSATATSTTAWDLESEKSAGRTRPTTDGAAITIRDSQSSQLGPRRILEHPSEVEVEVQPHHQVEVEAGA
jgi:hypothetical protein